MPNKYGLINCSNFTSATALPAFSAGNSIEIVNENKKHEQNMKMNFMLASE